MQIERSTTWANPPTVYAESSVAGIDKRLEYTGIELGSSRMQKRRLTTRAIPPEMCERYCYWYYGTTETRAMLRSSFFVIDMTTDSSVGRAGDCRMNPISDISRSLVQIRLGGVDFQLDANDFVQRKKKSLDDRSKKIQCILIIFSFLVPSTYY